MTETETAAWPVRGARSGQAGRAAVLALLLADMTPQPVLAGESTQVQRRADQPLPHDFPWGQQTISVSVPADEPDSAGTLDVTISEAGLVLTRLSTRRIGRLDMSAVTDLNDDESPEVILGLTGGPSGAPALQVWSWSAEVHAFARLVLPAVRSDQALTGGEFRVQDKGLYWAARGEDGAAVVYRLDLDHQRWERERRILPWLGRRLGL